MLPSLHAGKSYSRSYCLSLEKAIYKTDLCPDPQKTTLKSSLQKAWIPRPKLSHTNSVA